MSNKFVGGDTAEDVLPLLAELRSQNKGALFAYSVEVDEKEAAGIAKAGAAESGSGSSKLPYMRNVDEMMHSIDVAADFEDRLANERGSDFGRKTWVAVKLVRAESNSTRIHSTLQTEQTALLPDSNALIKLSALLAKNRPVNKQIAFPGCPSPPDLTAFYEKSLSNSHLSAIDIEDLKNLHNNLVRICSRAQERGVRINVDAEHRYVRFSRLCLLSNVHERRFLLNIFSWYQVCSP